MKVLDVIGTGVKAAAQAVARAVVPEQRPAGREGAEELRRRAEVNAAAARRRAARAAELFGDDGRWLPPRAGWLDRRR